MALQRDERLSVAPNRLNGLEGLLKFLNDF